MNHRRVPTPIQPPPLQAPPLVPPPVVSGARVDEGPTLSARDCLLGSVMGLVGAGVVAACALMWIGQSGLVSSRPIAPGPIADVPAAEVELTVAQPVVAELADRKSSQLVSLMTQEPSDEPENRAALATPGSLQQLSAAAIAAEPTGQDNESHELDDQAERSPAIANSQPLPMVEVSDDLPTSVLSLDSLAAETFLGPGKCESGVCEIETQSHGTELQWADTPADAYEAAAKSDKLVFLIHVSGNFEIPGFT